jgi:hypothetical protein
MGSGDRIKFSRAGSFGLGLYVDRFPFALTFNVHVLMWALSVGIGRAYDAPPPVTA